MSDIIPTPFDAAIDLLRDRERQLDTEAQAIIIRRDEVREMIAVLTSRKPRAPRKPRVVQDAANDTSSFGHVDVPSTKRETAETPRPTVFAAPCVSEASEAA